MRPRRCALAVLVTACLSGCASVDWDHQLAASNQEAAAFTGGGLELARSAEQQSARQARADRLLAAPLGQAEAVQLALAHSPALQAALAQHAAAAAELAQGARPANPLLTLERTRLGGELELARQLSFGLFDLITLPARSALVRQRLQAAGVQLTADVVAQVTAVRQAWVRAVAARQALAYARQVADSAAASAELARRMQAVGNWSRLTRSRQQLFHADAVTQLALAQQADLAAREALVRLLGLDAAQAARLQLPERLPDLPGQPWTPEAVAGAAFEARLDVRLARLRYDAAAQARGLGTVGSLIDVEAGLRHDSVWDGSNAGHTSRHGWELGLRLPLLDPGDLRRAALDAQTLAAAQQYQATLRSAESQLRESYASYRTAWELARHFQTEVVPLRQRMQEDNVLRYNAMLIGVFELLQDAREQVQSVIAALAAQQQFWLADAALQAELVGQPVGTAGVAAPVLTGGRDVASH